MVLVALILHANYPDSMPYRHAFAITSAFLGMVTFVCFILCSDRLSKYDKKMGSSFKKRQSHLEKETEGKPGHESLSLANHVNANPRYEVDASGLDANCPQIIPMNHVNHVTVHANHVNHIGNHVH